MKIFIAILFGLLAAVQAKSNYTVTDEAWFDVEIKDLDGKNEDYRGRFTIALFGDVTPVSRLNFVSLVKGYKPVHTNDLEKWRAAQAESRNPDRRMDKPLTKLHYMDTDIHRVVPDFAIQMGDVLSKDGRGSTSIYGDRFNDEPFTLSHRSPGWVAMANHGKNTNGSQFFILLSKARWLDGKHVVFGKVIRGMKVVTTIGDVKSNPDTAVPDTKITIVDCGLNKLDKPYELSESDLDSTEDL